STSRAEAASIETFGVIARCLHLIASVGLVGGAALLLIAGRSDRPTALEWQRRIVRSSLGLALFALAAALVALAHPTAVVSRRHDRCRVRRAARAGHRSLDRRTAAAGGAPARGRRRARRRRAPVRGAGRPPVLARGPGLSRRSRGERRRQRRHPRRRCPRSAR